MEELADSQLAPEPYTHQLGDGVVTAEQLSEHIRRNPGMYDMNLDRHMEANGIVVERPGFETEAAEAAERAPVAHNWEQIASDAPISPAHEVEHQELGRALDPKFDERTSAEQRAIGTILELGDESLLVSAEQKPAAENTFGAVFVTDIEQVNQVKQAVNLPPDIPVRDFKVIHSLDRSKTAQVFEHAYRHGGTEGSAEAWRERVFGEGEIAVLRQDIANRLEVPVAQRQGQALEVGGRERRPIMDISLDGVAATEVVDTITKRNEGLDAVIRDLSEARDRGKPLHVSQIAELLSSAAVIGRHHGRLLEGHHDGNPGGTIADLYIDEQDLAKYDTIDSLIEQVRLHSEVPGPPMRERLASELLVLASNSFPSGVEFMHGINQNVIADVVELGAIAPRSQRKHGVGNGSTSVNGGFVHMTSPGGFASEYGKTLVGIPIDTIVEHSPYLQLEDSYIGNERTKIGAEGDYTVASDQYHLGAIEVRNLATAPLAFQMAFQNMQSNIAKGLMHVGVGQGNYDNYSFAAGNTVDTATAYSYPLDELSLYVDGENAQTLFSAAADNQVLEPVANRTTVVVNTDHTVEHASQFGYSLNCAELPNFAMPADDGPMKFYAPISVREVSFTESMAGNDKLERAIAHTLESIKSSAVADHLEGLIADGMDVREAFTAAVDSVNNHSGQPWSIVTSYIGGEAVFRSADISPQELFNELSDDAVTCTNIPGFIANLREYDPQLDGISDTTAEGRRVLSWNNRGQYAPPTFKQELMRAYANRLYEASQEKFASYAAIIESVGVELNAEQRQAVNVYEAAQQRRHEAFERDGYKPPSMPGFSF